MKVGSSGRLGGGLKAGLRFGIILAASCHSPSANPGLEGQAGGGGASPPGVVGMELADPSCFSGGFSWCSLGDV